MVSHERKPYKITQTPDEMDKHMTTRKHPLSFCILNCAVPLQYTVVCAACLQGTHLVLAGTFLLDIRCFSAESLQDPLSLTQKEDYWHEFTSGLATLCL